MRKTEDMNLGCHDNYQTETVKAQTTLLQLHVNALWWSEMGMAVEQSTQTRIAGMTTYK